MMYNEKEKNQGNLDDFREKMEQDLDPGDLYDKEPFAKEAQPDEP